MTSVTSIPPAKTISALASLLLGGAVLGAVTVQGWLPSASRAQSRSAPSGLSHQSFVAAAVERSGPAVVTLETARTVTSSGMTGLPKGLLMDPLFRHFFGVPGASAPRSRVQRGQGSGVIFDAEGLVLTNAHVVEGADTLQVELTDGRSVEAKVVGKDSLTDLAVVRLEGKGPWPIAALGDSDRLKVCLLYTSPSPRDTNPSRMPSSA